MDSHFGMSLIFKKNVRKTSHIFSYAELNYTHQRGEGMGTGRLQVDSLL